MKLEIKIIGLNNHQPIVLNLQPYQKETTQTNNNGVIVILSKENLIINFILYFLNLTP